MQVKRHSVCGVRGGVKEEVYNGEVDWAVCRWFDGKGYMTPLKTFDGELLAGIPAGTWVAISDDQERVAGKGLTIDEALEDAKQNGEPEPYILRIPVHNSALIV